MKHFAGHQDHPFSLIDHLDSEAGQAIDFFKNLTKDTGLPFLGNVKKNLTLIDMIGSPRRCLLSPFSIYPGQIEKIKNGKLLLLGIMGYPEFNPLMAERILNEEIKCTSGYLELPFLHKKANLFSFEIAQKLDEDDAQDELAKTIKQKIKKKKLTHLAFPPVLGIKNTIRIFDKLSENLEQECFELAPLLPSLPGYRLQKSLENIAREKGIKIWPGEVISGRMEKGRVREVVVSYKRNKYKIEPKFVIMATGKFIGGGLRANEKIYEPIFNLPLFNKGKKISRIKIRNLLSEKISHLQPLFSSGLKVNKSFQPLNKENKIIAENLFAVGLILQGDDFVRDGNGLGISLLTGYYVGKIVSEML